MLVSACIQTVSVCLQLLGVLAYTITAFLHSLNYVREDRMATRPAEQQLDVTRVSLQGFELHQHEKKAKEKQRTGI